MQESVIYQDILQKGIAQGLQIGLQNALQTGFQIGQSKVIIRLLTLRFGAIAPDLVERIRALSIPQLDQLVEAQLEFSSVEDLVTWLERTRS
jgi:predicted transposase YdaD